MRPKPYTAPVDNESIHVLGEDEGFTRQSERGYTDRPQDEVTTRADSRAFLNRVIDDVLSVSARPGKVMSLYGMGGQGKTHMLVGLYDTLRSRALPGTRCAFHSFEGCEASSVPSMLKDLADLLESEGVACPGFKMAYYSYRASTSNACKAGKEFREDYRRFAEEHGYGLAESFFTLASAFFALVFPVQAAAATGVAGAVGLARAVQNGWRRRELDDVWESIRSIADPASLERSLVDYLSRDIEHWCSEGPGNGKLVVFLDTFEKVGWDGGSGIRAGRYDWARALTKTPGTLWIVAGRIRVSWCNVVCYPLQLVEMDEAEARALLEEKGVCDPAVVEAVVGRSGRLPIYLSLCAEMVVRNPGVDIDELLGDGGAEGLVDRYLMNLDPDARECACAAAFLEYWDAGLFSNLPGAGLSPRSVDRLNDMSFVRRRAEGFEMHEIVASLLRGSCGIESLKARLYRALGARVTELGSPTCALPQVQRGREMRHLLHSQVLLADAGVEGISRKDEFDMRMSYAEAVWRDGDNGLAMLLFSSICDAFSPEGSPTVEYLRTRLKVAAMETAFYLGGEGREHHERAIDITRDVLELTRKHHPQETLLLWSVLSDLGVSLNRFGRYEEALGYQGEVYSAISERDPGSYSADEARFASCYGATCQCYADHLGGGEDAGRYYAMALEAYGKAYAARRMIYGPSGAIWRL